MSEFNNNINISLIINEIKLHLGIKTDTQLAEYLGVNQSNIATWRKRNVLNFHLIIEKCPEIDANWLLTGKGEMLKENNKKQGIDADLKDQHQELQKYLDEHQGNFDINELLSNETEINILKGIVEDYKKQIIEKDRQLSERDKQINKLLDLISK